MISTTFNAFVCSWPFDPWLSISLLLTAGLYLRGWLVLHQRDVRRWPHARLLAFLAGLMSIFLALASPIEPFAGLLLQVHMVQHLLLMMAAPPLLWLGAPFFPLLRGLPRPIRTYWVGPLLRWRPLRRLLETATHPLPALLLFTAATWFWHLPAIYEIALRSVSAHYLQHACFLGTALLFWYPVIRPYPARPGWSLWLLIPYLILADVQNTILSAVLTFADRPLYAYYVSMPRLGNLSPLEDQGTAGVLMWVPGSVAFLLPLFWIGMRLLYGKGESEGSAVPPPRACEKMGTGSGPHSQSIDNSRDRPVHVPIYSQALGTQFSLPAGSKLQQSTARIALPLAGPRQKTTAAPDLLRLPWIGRFLRWRHARPVLQLPLVALAALVIYDGLRGPQVGAMNLAGVLPWIHWRGFVILGLLSLGNVFCMACPFMLPRTLARRWLPQGRNWPRWLRSKWLAVALLVAFLWAYETFALWDSPWWTAWIAVGYFAAAFVIDACFRGAAFCKYVCPIGQFNFVQSLVSPMEVRVRDPEICASCHTKDCIRGGNGVPGCELNLYQPRKAGSLDCTFCLDCIHACPHDNIGIFGGAPGKQLWHDSLRSGLGRLSKRQDIAALVIVLTFGAFANAAGMVAPVLEWQDQLAAVLPSQSPMLTTSLLYAFGLLVLPLLLLGSSALISRWLGRLDISSSAVAMRFVYSLVPLGFSMWLAHYSFHFLGSFDTVIPALQRFAADLGWEALGKPDWTFSCCRPVASWLPRLEILFLDFGLLLSLYTGYRISRLHTSLPSQAFRVLAPWALLLVLLFAAGVWIVLQPMQMRGTLNMAG